MIEQMCLFCNSVVQVYSNGNMVEHAHPHRTIIKPAPRRLAKCNGSGRKSYKQVKSDLVVEEQSHG